MSNGIFSFAEWAIFNIKSRLYRMLRGNLSKNWVDLLSKICDDYNNTPLKKLGWLKPSEINTIYDSNLVSKSRQKHNIAVYKEPSFVQQNQNQKEYEKNKRNFQVNDYVYLDFKEDLFSKSFDVQV